MTTKGTAQTTQHTPGPDEEIHIVPMMENRDWLAIIVNGRETFVQFGTIAAAPEMQALLKGLVGADDIDRARVLVRAARALLAQIEGR